MWLGATYCTVFVAVAVWIGLMMFTRWSGRRRWSERYQDRLHRELDAVTRRDMPSPRQAPLTEL